MSLFQRRRGPGLRPRALIAVGVLSLIVGVWGMSGQIGFLSRVTSVEAEVVGVETLGADESFTLYRPTLRFSPTPGETIERPAAETFRPTRVGERLSVGFDPENPDDVRLMDIRDRWLSPSWMLVFAVLTFAFAAYRLRQGGAGTPDPSA